jgi:hypothetical protein
MGVVRGDTPQLPPRLGRRCSGGGTPPPRDTQHSSVSLSESRRAPASPDAAKRQGEEETEAKPAFTGPRRNLGANRARISLIACAPTAFIVRGLTFELSGQQRHAARPGLWKMCAHPRPRPGGMPLVLRLSEGLGRTVCEQIALT